MDPFSREETIVRGEGARYKCRATNRRLLSMNELSPETAVQASKLACEFHSLQALARG
jgi:hypothetical protein